MKTSHKKQLSTIVDSLTNLFETIPDLKLQKSPDVTFLKQLIHSKDVQGTLINAQYYKDSQVPVLGVVIRPDQDPSKFAFKLGSGSDFEKLTNAIAYTVGVMEHKNKEWASYARYIKNGGLSLSEFLGQATNVLEQPFTLALNTLLLMGGHIAKMQMDTNEKCILTRLNRTIVNAIKTDLRSLDNELAEYAIVKRELLNKDNIVAASLAALRV